MRDQGSTGVLPTEPATAASVEPRRFEPAISTEPSDDELAACARQPGWDESGFPVAPRDASFPARVWRFLER